MKFKGTKGEWIVELTNPKNVNVTSWINGNANGFIHSQNVTDFENRKESEANAKLISKAPELLELLNHFIEISDELSVPDYLIETFANLYANAFNTIQEATTI